jgi:TolA-binding protein
MRYLGISTLAIAATLLLGCEKTTTKPADAKIANAKQKIGEAVDATIEAAKAKRDEYVREMSKRLDEMNVKYEELKGSAAKAEGQAKKDLDKKLDEAKVKRDAAVKQLDELKNAGADRWEKVKDGVGSAFDDLKKIFE